MAFDFKKVYKELYMPKSKPEIIDIPEMNYIAIKGQGNPNEENGDYQKAINKLYAVAYAIKMSYKTDYMIEGFFEYVVPPLEGLWWLENEIEMNYSKKEDLNWISMIRLPDFVKMIDFDWAVKEVENKKKISCTNMEFFTYDEGLCVQIMHIGPFDKGYVSIDLMNDFIKEKKFENDLSKERYHHEIYLSDIRKLSPEKWKTIIRLPIKVI